MNPPPISELYETVDATWPAAALSRVGPWIIRDGRGGGKRVSAATLESNFSPADIAVGQARMAALGQTPLFMIREGEDRLDRALDGCGYSIIDPVSFYACPVAALATGHFTLGSEITQWPPSDIAKEIWAEGGIGAERLDVMSRVKGPRSVIVAQSGGETVGVGFAAVAGRIAMIHAIEVSPKLRRRRAGTAVLHSAADWAKNRGCDYLTLAVTDANRPANALYSKLGMSLVGSYHYRTK
ncbi:MAG: GNAT family N-acetyltransferase [Marinosulfonomonas sp.]|nr:GNAT family N-acetyltransferase [Marinosulfonomonas sp.]